MLDAVSEDNVTHNRHKKGSKKIVERSDSGTITLIIGKNRYTFWHRATVVLPYIYQFLRMKYPDSIILPEFNHIDFVVLDENIPIEVQSTIIIKDFMSHSYFEQMIEKQIVANIERYGKCWFFFDSEYFRYLQNGTSNAIRMNMTWFAKYVQDDLLNVFTVSHDGKINSVLYDDLKFLIGDAYDISSNKNEANILYQILLCHEYTSKEIRDFIDEKKLLPDKCATYAWLCRTECSDRKQILGRILTSMNRLKGINNMLYRKHTGEYKYVLKAACRMGILNNDFYYSFEDHYDIAKYFQGYNDNKAFWDNIKHKEFDIYKFLDIISGCQI